MLCSKILVHFTMFPFQLSHSFLLYCMRLFFLHVKWLATPCTILLFHRNPLGKHESERRERLDTRTIVLQGAPRTILSKSLQAIPEGGGGAKHVP